MGSYISSLGQRLAQSSGLSSSPTEETGQKAPLGQETHTEEELKSSVNEEKPLEEPESNDTSYGVEATAVRTLAASTGTVAILGTTAKVKESSETASGDIRNSPIEPEINDAKEITSNVVAQEDNSSTIASSEKEEAHVSVTDNTKNDLDKTCDVEGTPETDLHYLETHETKEDKTTDNGTTGVSLEEKRDEEADHKIKNKEVKDEEENKKELEQNDEDIMKEGLFNKPDVNVPHLIETSATADSKIPYSTNEGTGIEKEPVRIVDYQEKKDRAHGPKILEEMSVKKDENLIIVNHPVDIGAQKEEDFIKTVSINKHEGEKPDEERPTKIAISEEECNHTPPKSEPVSPEISKTEEENDISSEQLKTNSLSDMSLSENLNSEGEEAAREAAKALELKEMVASLSATANSITLDYDINQSINNTGDVSVDVNAVNPSLQVPEESKTVKIESSSLKDVPEENIEVDNTFEIPQTISEHSSEKEPSNTSLPETCEKALSSEENAKAENESDSLKENLDKPTDLSDIKPTESIISETKNNETEMISPMTKPHSEEIHGTKDISAIHQESEVQQKETETQQSILELKENSDEDEINKLKQKEAEPQHDEEIVTEPIKLEINKENGKEHEGIDQRKMPEENDHTKKEQQDIQQENKDKENKAMEAKDDQEAITAATTIQSGFRAYQVRKHLKEPKTDEENQKSLGHEEAKVFEEDENLLNGSTIPKPFDEIQETEQQENKFPGSSESNTSETEEDKVKNAPESLIKIAQAEVDKICKEAEKATESLMTPQLMKDDSETVAQEDEFPAPPDELLTSESQNEEIKEDLSSSGTQSTEPTMPLGSNHTEGDSSKTEDTTAPSLAESEMPKTTGQSPSLQNDDLRLESSVTENINTEIALQRDSTEGELTMEEDSTREDDILAPNRSDIVSKTDGEDSLTPEEDKAATVIQAGYRGFKTRKRLREESTTISDTGSVERMDIRNESSGLEISMKDEGESDISNSQSVDKSEKQLNDSAKKIQAGVRGYLVRKKQKVERDAAVTIQSHFRGFKTRQRLKQQST